MRDGSGALFSEGIFLAFTKKAGTYSPTRSFYVGARPNKKNPRLNRLKQFSWQGTNDAFEFHIEQDSG